MKTAAVVCEYNPMHEGHIRMLEKMRACMGSDCSVLCLMSGDFVQRGEPGVFDKYERARVAVENGADLVLELPYPWSASVAEHFAFGAVSLLDRFGVVDRLFFGSERRGEEELSKIAERLMNQEFLRFFAEMRKTERTSSFPRLWDRCYARFYGEPLALSSNEILGVYYLSALQKRKSRMEARALPLFESFSASVERKKLEGTKNSAFFENASSAFLTVLCLHGKGDRFSKAAARCSSVSELFRAVRTPSDTDARLHRELLSVILDVPVGAESIQPEFTVLLAANGKGRELLSQMRKCSAVTIVTKQADFSATGDALTQYELYLRAQNFYASFLGESHSADFLMKKKPYIAP